VRQSLLFSSVTVNEGTELLRTLVLPDVRIGINCRISGAIIDKRCQIPDHTVIGEDHADDAERFTVTEEGIVLVCPDMF
jgi:glucose-1-phosphate adenylyltransferase